MTRVVEARALMLAALKPLAPEEALLWDARGRVLAAPLRAVRAQPPFAASAMDGYALRARDTPGTLRIVGESAAGRGYSGVLQAGEAVRISTGAPLPPGADAVLVQEDAGVDGDRLRAPEVRPDRHVRAAGIDFAAGADILPEGRTLDPVALALAASAGAARLPVRRRPQVTILCGGDEVAPPGTDLRADQIFDSCSYAIGALAESWGAQATRCAPLPDDAAAIERAAASALRESDLVVFIGSASVGPHDHARPAFERQGARIVVSKVDMRPGKPTWFATSAHAPVLGLPGNPASAIVAALLFLRPAIAALLGVASGVEFSRGALAGALPANGPREAFLRARWRCTETGAISVDVHGEQDSSLLSVFAGSNALVRREPHAPPAGPGDPVDWLSYSY